MSKLLSSRLSISLVVFLLLEALLYKGFLLNLDSKLLFNAGDPVLNLYFLKFGSDYLLGNVTGYSIFNLPVAFPFNSSLAFSDNLFGNQLIFFPYYVLTGKPLLSFNLWFLTAHFLNYIAMYLYIDKSKFIAINNKSVIAIIGAVIVAFSIPSLDLLGGHLQLISLFFIPVSLFFLEKTIIELSYRNFLFLGLSMSFQFYLGIQTGFILLVLLMLLLPVYCYHLLNNKALFFKRIWISVLAFSVPTALLLMPYFEVSKLTGHRAYSEVLNYIPSITNFFSIGIGEKSIFMGGAIFVLLVLSVFLMRTKKSIVLFGVVVLSFFFFLKEPQIFKLFFDYVPGFDSIRTPGRFVLASIICVAIFVSLVLSRIEIRWLKYIFMVFVVSMSTSLYQKNIPSMEYEYFDNQTHPELLQIINRDPVLILPLYEIKNPELYEVIRRMKDVNMEFPILDIYSGFNPTFVAEIESQYQLIGKKEGASNGKRFVERVIKLGFRNILLEKDKVTNDGLMQSIEESGFQEKYEDSKVIFYSCMKCEKASTSLNESLKNSLWKLKVKDFKNTEGRLVFIGYLEGKELSGVVQEKEEIPTTAILGRGSYPCKLQLDSIKDSFSSFECVSEKYYPEFASMDKALNDHGVTYKLIQPYDNKTTLVKLKVTNSGSETWLPGFSGKYGLALSYRVENESNGIKTEYDNRFHLPYKVEAGKSFEISIPIKGLSKGGNIITISMVQELVAWFHDRGSDPLIVDIKI